MAIKSLAYLFAKRLIIYFRNNFKGFIPHVCIKLSSRSVSIRGVSSYQSRTFHVIELFAEAIAQAQAEQKKIKSMAYRIFCSDYVSRYPAFGDKSSDKKRSCALHFRQYTGSKIVNLFLLLLVDDVARWLPDFCAP